MDSQIKETLNNLLTVSILIFVVFFCFDLFAAKEMRVPIEIAKDTYLAPDATEIRGYFLTIVIALVGFAAKELYQAFQRAKDTTASDINELKKDVRTILNQQALMMEQMRNKADKIDVTKEILDRVQKEMEHASRLQR